VVFTAFVPVVTIDSGWHEGGPTPRRAGSASPHFAGVGEMFVAPWVSSCEHAADVRRWMCGTVGRVRAYGPQRGGNTMRTLLRIHMRGDVANRAVQDGTWPKTLEELLDRVHPEASYFFADKGHRSAFIVFDLEDSAQIPVISEPLFSQLGAEVEYTPVMNGDDLRKGLGAVAGGGA
jgi:hypothetical protein